MIGLLIEKLQKAGLILSDRDLASYTEAESLIGDEDIADAIWLALQMGADAGTIADDNPETAAPESTVTIEEVAGVQELSPPAVSAYLPNSRREPSTTEQPESGLPIQVQAAPALQDPLSIGRALRPLMRKTRSQSQQVLDEVATVDNIAERKIWLPVLKPALERWLDLELVIEASEFSFIWEDTLLEFRHLLERQGAFRNVRNWWLEGTDGGKLNLVSRKSQSAITQSHRSPKELIDPTGRRLVLLVSDCRSKVWQSGDIHSLLQMWSIHEPTVIVQLLPERLWDQTELDVGVSVQASALIPGAPGPKLRIKQRSGWNEAELADALTVPVVTLAAKSLKQWALVVAAAGRQYTPARLFDLSWVKDQERDRTASVVNPKSPETRVELFNATASPIAKQLASMMAAVPVDLNVVHLIQKRLLPDAKPVHVAEVYDSHLLTRVNTKRSPNEPIRYDFAPGVRDLLVERTPTDQTTKVLDTLSQAIAESLNLPPIKSFTALLSPKSNWSLEAQAAILPFAQVATQVLRSLGGDYATLAEMVEQDAQQRTDWISSPTESPFPELEILEFITAQLVEPATETLSHSLQTQEVEVATIKKSQGNEWVIRKQRQQIQQWVEDLGDGIQLEMVVIPSGRFMMGSPENERERSSSEGPQHEVNIKAFFMGKYPVTQAQWKAVVALPQVNRELKPDPSRFKGENHPVERVSWYDVVEFCDRLSQSTGREYRLPTEAEWEYACRAGTQTPFHFGEILTTDLANYNGNYSYSDGPKGEYREQTTPVDHFKLANAFGLCDMHGNVYEWCQDHWHDSYKDAPADGSAWSSENENDSRVIRGGSWIDNPWDCRSAYRIYNPPVIADSYIGFRVVCLAPRTS